MSLTCFCGQPAKFHPCILGANGLLTQEPMCTDCYAAEFPERWAAFELAHKAPNAAELHDRGNSARRTVKEHSQVPMSPAQPDAPWKLSDSGGYKCPNCGRQSLYRNITALCKNPMCDYEEAKAGKLPRRVKWLVLSKFGERWPWYKKWWHWITRTGKVVYLWPWERD